MTLTVWIVPFIFVVFVTLTITLYAVRRSSNLASLSSGRDEVGDAFEEHPFTLNPIIWIILIASVFIGIVIVYYAIGY